MTDKDIIKGMRREHDRLIVEGRRVEDENARLQADLAELRQAGIDSYNNQIAVLETHLEDAEALAERRKKALPAIVFALAYSDYGDPGITVESCIEKWERHLKPALQEEHSGDCTNQCHSCARCQAEDCVKMADELARAAIEEARHPDGD